MTMLRPPDSKVIADDVRRALDEDVGTGDCTAALVPAAQTAQATVISREAGVLCGRPWFDAVFAELAPQVRVDWHAHDGEQVRPEQVLCELTGPARSLLTGERTALNFLQLLSGTATITRQYVDAVAGSDVHILDTRKTLPGLRAAQKYAVRCGGGHNHRRGLYDQVLIKENHISAAASLGAAVKQARRTAPGLVVEVEVETLAQLEEAIQAGADIIMLDNFSLNEISEAASAVARTTGHGPRPQLEVSGNVDLDGIGALAATGVDRISVGALTKNVRAMDLSMRLL